MGHHMGMLQGITLEMQSMEPGKKKEMGEWGTTRKQQSAYTVIWEASPDSGADITLSSASSRGRYIATLNPTEGRWFQRLASGMGARIGDIVSQDRAYTIGILLKLLSMFELEWSNFGMDMPLESICSCSSYSRA